MIHKGNPMAFNRSMLLLALNSSRIDNDLNLYHVSYGLDITKDMRSIYQMEHVNVLNFIVTG